MKNPIILFFLNPSGDKDRTHGIDIWPDWIGKPIIKKSGKPFKSGLKTGTPKDITINENSGELGFLMDDGSVVNCDICKLKE